ncbi:hypothetical protein BDA96_03G028200 [Sorghum bicolor]|uniref:Uncharacterized protein n=1 Tax=Sorghum bicolor TaxID=4558 RepID=A0A921RAZ5_SORBI|nr:hypothetical protein BDA96_03G028200 [Sorghum bicolor]
MPTSRRLAEAKPAGSNAEAAANPRDQDDILQSKQGEAATQEQSRAEQSRTGGSICDREPTPSARPYLFQSRSSSSQVRAHRPTRAAVAVVPTLPLPLYHHVYRRYVENPAAPHGDGDARMQTQCRVGESSNVRRSIHIVVSSVVYRWLCVLFELGMTGWPAGRFCCHVVRHSRNLSIGIESGPTRLLCLLLLRPAGSCRRVRVLLRLVAACSFLVGTNQQF